MMVTAMVVIIDYRFTDSLPGVLQPEDCRVGEGGTNLEDSIEVVETPADVSHGGPLLCSKTVREWNGMVREELTNDLHSGGDAGARHYLRHDQATHLQ